MGRTLAVACALLVGFPTAAAAKPVKSAPSCKVADVTANGQAALECAVHAGNDRLGARPEEYTVNELGLFGRTDWQFLGKVEGGASGAEGLAVTGVGGASGEWRVGEELSKDFEAFAVVLKAGDAFAAYLFSSLVADGGAWSRFGRADLSHLTVYARGRIVFEDETDSGGGHTDGGGGVPVPVPEPEPAALLGLGALAAALARRQRKAA